MNRLLALCLFGLACTAGCSLDLGNTDQNNDGQGDDAMGDDTTPPDLPGDVYRQCVLDTLDRCDAADLTPDECTALIAATCNDGQPCDPNTMDPDGSAGCPPPCDPSTDPMGCPPPDDCYTTVFRDCVEQGIDPMDCAVRADLVCYPQCQPGDPNCCMPDGSGFCCDPSTGMACCQPGDPNCEPPPCDPSTGMGCDCWSQVFFDCISSGIPEDACWARADEVCYPPTCTDPNDPSCEPPPCDPSTGMGCCQPGDPNCEPWPPCDPTNDPMCLPPDDGSPN